MGLEILWEFEIQCYLRAGIHTVKWLRTSFAILTTKRLYNPIKKYNCGNSLWVH